MTAPPHDVGVAVQVLRRRVDDDVDPEFERPLAVRRHERVVGDGNGPRLFRHPRDRLDIDQIQERVAGGFDPDALRLRRDRPADVVHILHVDERKRQPEIGERRNEQPERPAVDVVPGDDVVPRLEQVHRGGDGGHAGTGGAAVDPPFQRGEALFERPARRVSAAGVVVTLRFPQRLEPERRGRVDRGDATVERVVLADPDVDAPGFKLLL
jgi:hypothetical protein